MKHYSFPSIEQFRNVIRNVSHTIRFGGINPDTNEVTYLDIPLPILKFKGTVKLHGTNGGIILSKDGEISIQSRENNLSIYHDNAGFWLFCQNIPNTFFQEIKDLFLKDNVKALGIYGEWCGGNIQKGVAINGLPKMFVIFAIKKIYDLIPDEDGKVNSEWINYNEWKDIHLNSNNIYNIYQFPTYDIEIDFNNPEDSQNILVKLTEEVEKECPVGKYFGKISIGEGIVWTPTDPNYNNSGY